MPRLSHGINTPHLVETDTNGGACTARDMRNKVSSLSVAGWGSNKGDFWTDIEGVSSGHTLVLCDTESYHLKDCVHVTITTVPTLKILTLLYIENGGS